jgi:hypothetical protein
VTTPYDDAVRLRAAINAYSEVVEECTRDGRTFRNLDHHRAMTMALEAADRVGGPHLVALARAERKLASLRTIAAAAQSQISMLCDELENAERAVEKVRPRPMDSPTDPGEP